MQLRARWPAVRAALIALALGFGLIDGCPIPERKYAPPWAQDLAERGHEIRRALRRPVAELAADLDIRQRWALFSSASPRRYRMYLEGKTATGDWELVHRAGDPAHAAYEDLLAFRRVRGTYNPSGTYARSQYHNFSMWMVQRLLDDRPDFVVGRTRMERIVIGQGGYTPTGEFTLERQWWRRRR